MFGLSVDLDGLADRDMEFEMPTGRGGEFPHGGGSYLRNKPKPAILSREMLRLIFVSIR